MTEHIKVVVVDDDYIVRKVIISVLTDIGCDVIGKASTGAQALEVVKELKPDVVLMDIEMPEMDGIAATRRLQDIYPVPVVILSAYETPELLQRAAEVGAGAYLTKPPKAAEMQRAILIAVARHKDLMKIRDLMREMNHRIKNNLNVIMSLLSLQSHASGDEETKAVLAEAKGRVSSMSMIHSLLYKSNKVGRINLGEYIRDLSTQVFQSNNINNKITLKLSVDDVDVDVDSAIPCGLIVNELITNSLKYAFADDRDGVIEVSLGKFNDGLSIAVKDDGVGVGDIDLASLKTLGMNLVNILTKQLEGTVEFTSLCGTQAVVKFQLPGGKPL